MAEQRSTLIIEISSEQAARNARALDRELQSIERTGNYATTSMNSMSVAARQLAGYLAGVVTVGTAISKMDTYTGLQNRLKLVTNDQKALNQAMQDTFGIAQKTAASWDSTAMVYQRFADNAQRLGITMKTTAELTETVSKAISISGGSAASAEAALMQFGQALASGVLRGEEFNSIAEQAPGLLKAIAQGMGVNIGQLRSMAGEGKITGDALVSALTNAKTSVDELFGKTDFTIAQSFTQLSNAVTKFVGEAGKGSGAASAISSSLSSLANNLGTVTNIAMIGGAYWLGTYIPALYKSVAAQQTRITTLVSEVRAEQLANEITAQRTARIAHLSTIELANAEAQLARMTGMARIAYLEKTVLPLRQANTAALQADTIAQNANNASKSLATRAGTSLIGVLGGPVGLGLTVAAVGASMLLMGDNTESATTSLENQKKTVSELTAEYGKLSTAKLVSEMDEIDKRVSAAESKISKSKNGLLGMVAGNSDSISNEEIKRQNLILDQLKKIEKEGLSTASALQAIDASKLFTDGEIKQAQKFFAKMEEGNNELARGTAQRQLANSALDKASGIYENLAKESSNLTLEQERLTSSLESAKSGFSFVSDSLLQSAANAGVSKDGIEQLKKSINAYSAGALSATALLKEFQKYIPIKDSDLKSYLQIANNVEAQQKALTLNEIQLKKNKSTQDGLNKSLSDSNITGANFNKVLEDGTKKAVATSESVKGLSAEIQKFINQSLSDISTNSEILALRAKGISKEVAENYVKLKEAQGLLGKNQPIDTGAFSLMMADLALKKQIQDLDDKQTKAKQDQTKELERQQKLQEKQAVLLAGNNEQTRNMLRVYQSFRNAGLGDKQARVMTAQVGRENDFRNSDMFGSHKDANNGYTNTGFISWQKGRSTQLMQFLQGQGVLDKNGKIQQSQDALDAMAKFLMQEIATGKSYGKTKNALNNDNLSYRELEKIVGQNFIGWDYNGKKLGKDKASQHLSKQDNYFNQISKILGANPENVMSSIKDLSKFEDEAFKARAKTEEEIKKLQAKYDTEAITRSKAREEAINEATVLGQLDLLPKIKERYDAQDKLAQLQIDEDLNSYKWTENQKLVYTYQTNKLRLDAEGKLSDDVKELAKKSLDEQMFYETQKRLQTNSLGIGQIQIDAQSYVRQKQNPLGFQQDQLDSETINKYRELQLKYSSQRGDIFTLVDEENARNQQLLDAHEKFLIARKALDEKYQVDQQDIARNQFDAQLALYGRLLNTTSSTWGNMTQIMRDSAGEQSAIYKLMFGIQQTMAIATATINAYQAYSSVLAEPLIPIAIKMPLANTILGLGMANVGMIAGQAIAGFSNGGFTGSGGKYDPAGIVHKGEVVFSQEDIVRWGGVNNVEAMRKGNMIGFAGGGYVSESKVPAINSSFPGLTNFNKSRVLDSINQQNSDKDLTPVITINVSVQSDGSSGVDINGGASQNLKQFAQFIGTEVERVVRKECNQGGVIDREFRKRR